MFLISRNRFSKSIRKHNIFEKKDRLETLYTINIEQDFDDSVSKVWAAITEAEQMKKWFFEQIHEFKAEKGFKTSFLVEFGGYQFTHLWKIEEAIPLKKIVYDWSYAEYDGIAKVIFELSEKDGSVVLKLTNIVTKPFPNNIEAFTRESAEEGWTYLIKKSLKQYLEA